MNKNVNTHIMYSTARIYLNTFFVLYVYDTCSSVCMYVCMYVCKLLFKSKKEKTNDASLISYKLVSMRGVGTHLNK
jgi:hypothetical protein